ncbi:spore coat protein [Shewanella mangrovi]|uniref:dTDP-glucose 4,6-dehydratase n=1 Tax=Shewanella mangrovi TaxID=1515746 RepID=A0A094JFT1_9GAMM|nr:dTDP-glucose 4,6-dehydratase [Shewanella mangrovi]KFZ36854.1 spore coat protein [Shewanella mangrovi]
MKRLLVTGGAGFIGTNFVNYWLAQHPNDSVTVLDALTYAGNADNLQSVMKSPKFRFVKGDICDTDLVESLLRHEQIDTLVHLAAESHVDRSISGPDKFVETNIVGTHSLLKAARKVWLADPANPIEHRFHHVSTDEVYGSLMPSDQPFNESTPYAPNSPYAASKAASDHLVRSYHQTYGLQITISNCSNNYGYYQFPEKLIPLCITNILQGKLIPIYGDGHQIRDWLSVEDHCRGIDLILQRGEIGESYNIGGMDEWRNIDTVTLLCKLLDEEFAADSLLIRRFTASPYARGLSASSLITYVTDRAGHDRRYGVDCRKIITELGFAPRVGFVDGLKQTIRWYLNNEQWVDSFSTVG